MPTYKTEREAWQALLDVLEGYGMPDYNKHFICIGLCPAVLAMHDDRAVSENTHYAMLRRINRYLSGKKITRLGEWGDPVPRRRFVRAVLEDLS